MNPVKITTGALTVDGQKILTFHYDFSQRPYCVKRDGLRKLTAPELTGALDAVEAWVVGTIEEAATKEKYIEVLKNSIHDVRMLCDDDYRNRVKREEQEKIIDELTTQNNYLKTQVEKLKSEPCELKVIKVLDCGHKDGSVYSWYLTDDDKADYKVGDVVEVEHLGGFRNEFLPVVSVRAVSESDRPACKVVGLANR